jgi:hypothetical protein
MVVAHLASQVCLIVPLRSFSEVRILYAIGGACRMRDPIIVRHSPLIL